MSAEYFLAIDAHICMLRGSVVVLDLSSGKYFALNAEQSSAAGAYVKGWPRSHVDTTAAGENALTTLLQHGIITTDASRGKIACPVQVAKPKAWIGEFRPRGWPEIRMQHVGRFAVAVLTAFMSLRTKKLQRAIERVARRKSVRGARDISAEELAELVRVFDWLRPLAFHRRDTCLLYTLALLEFLALYNVFPDWIFGVSAAPFKAHCWLQSGEVLLTDTPFNTDALAPIMVV